MFVKIEGEGELPSGISFYHQQDRNFLLGMSKTVKKDEITWDSFADARKDWDILCKNGYQFLLLLWRENNLLHAKFYSDTKRVRAVEYLNAVFKDMGLVRGDSFAAEGQITLALLWTQIQKKEKENLVDYFCHRCEAYFTNTDCIEAEEYAKENEKEIRDLPMYRKRKIPWSYVLSTDIAPVGTRLFFRSLENESGFEVVSEDDLIIMIGTQGEVYHIACEKFEKTYQATEEELDIFANMTVFLPEVRIMPDGEYVNIDEIAHICYPKPGNPIYAKPIDRRTKIFPVYDKENYFLGKPGDYMVVRTDDMNDIYIVQKRIFEYTYEEVS